MITNSENKHLVYLATVNDRFGAEYEQVDATSFKVWLAEVPFGKPFFWVRFREFTTVRTEAEARAMCVDLVRIKGETVREWCPSQRHIFDVPLTVKPAQPEVPAEAPTR